MDHIVAMQDNKSDIRVLVNRKFSSRLKTKHIQVKYFLATDLIKREEMEMEYFPAELMWADVLKKPKQEEDFFLDCSQIMNVSIDYDDEVKRKQTNPRLLPK